MDRAVNPKTGEVVFLVNNQWVKPDQTAQNPKTGEMAYLVGGAWQVVPGAKKVAEVSAPIVSPEEMLTPITESPEMAALREKTKQYEAGTTMGERAKRDLQRGVIALQKMPAELQVSSIQKEIDRIRSGQAGRTDTMTGEFIPMAPEEEEAAIAALQARQAEALQDVQKRRAEMQAIPARPVTEAIGGAKTFGEAIQALGTDPFGAMAGFSLESLPQMAPALATAVLTKQPALGAAAMGGTSFTSELSNSVFEYLEDQGIDINDSQAVLKALDDPKIFKEAYDFAIKRGAIIGTLDAASAGLASKALVPKKLIGSPKAREAVNIAIAQPASQVISGAGGEAAAQLATYGEIKKPGAVVAEAVGEGPTSLAETAAFGGRRIYEELRSKEGAPEVKAEAKAEPKVEAKPEARIEPTIEPTKEPEAGITPAFKAEELEGEEAPKPIDQAEVTRLEAELAKVQKKQMDPTLSLDDPRLAEFQQQEADIKARIEEARGEAPAEDLYNRLIKATPKELKTIDIPTAKAPDLYLRASEDKNASPALVNRLTKIVNEMEPAEFEAPQVAAPVVKAAEKPAAEATVDLSRYTEIMQKRNEGMTMTDIQEENPELDVINTVVQGLNAESERKTPKSREKEVAALINRMLMEDRSSKEIPAMDQDIERLKMLKQINTLLRKVTSTTPKADRKPIDKQVDSLIKVVSKQPMGRFVPEAALDASIEGLIRTNPKTFIDYYGDDGPRVRMLLRKFSTKEDLRRWYNNTIQPQVNKIQKSLFTSKTPTIKLDEPYTLNYLLKRFDEVKAETRPATEAAPPKPKKPAKPTKEEQAAINRERQAKKREEAAAKKAAPKPVEKVEEVEEVEEVIEEEEVAAPAAEVETVKVEREYSDDDLKEQLKRFEVGNFTLPKAAGTGVEGREAADEMNQRYKDIYKEATRVFLESPITAKPGKLELTEGLTGIAPRPIVKNITPKVKTFDDQIKNLEASAAKQDIRYYLNGVFLNKTKNEMVVTDGHRIAVWKDPNFEGMPAAEGDQIMSFKREFIDGKYPDYVRVLPDKHDKDKTRVEAAPLGNYARGVSKAAGFIGKDKYAPMQLRFGPRSVKVNSKYISDMTDIFRRFGYDTFDMSIGIDPKNPQTGTKIYATSPDGKLVQAVMPIADRFDTKFASYSIPGVKEIKEVKEVIQTADKEKKEAEEKRIADIAAENEAVQVRIDSAKQTGRFDDFIDNWVTTDDIDNALRDLLTKNFEYDGKFEPRAELIEQMIEDGYVLSRDGYGNRVLTKGALRFNEEILSETGLDYAQYLLAKRQPAQENLMFDTRVLLNKLNSSARIDRDELIKTYSSIRAKGRRTIREVAKYGSDIPMQRELNKLLGYEQELKDYLDATAPVRNSAQDFLAKAAKEQADENISPEVFDFINDVYRKQPKLLEGIRLSVRSRKEPGRSTGNFDPFNRIITLWKNASGVNDPETIRHEMTHTLEQMMLPSAQKAVADAWARAFERAMKKNTDAPSTVYFEAVMEYLANPTKEKYAEAIARLPNYSFYQYMNPSEFWAVNAESLMGAQMGSGWDRFKKTVRKLFELLKSFFGFNNNYVVHREFDKVINGKQERVTKRTITQLIEGGGFQPTFLENVEDVDKLLEKHNRPDAPLPPSGSVKERLLNTYNYGKNIGQAVVESPLTVGKNVISGADRAITYARNKNVWYGTGLDQADFSRYNGQLRDSQGKAVASIALTNAIHAGHVGTQVMVQGGLEYNDKTKQFMAVKRAKSMANVLKEKAKLVNQLGAQRAANVIQAYFEAKRSRSIITEYLQRQETYEKALDAGENPDEAAEALANIERAASKVRMDEEQIAEFIALENEYPELRAMMDNWTAVNQNMLDNLYFAGNLSKARYENLKSIKDYVPWYRIMDDQKDIHDAPAEGTTRTMTNVGREKRFKYGEVERDIDDIVDNMIHNVMWLTRNVMRNYAANRVADEYGVRNEKGKLKVFPKEGVDSQGVKFNILRNGRRIVVAVEDPLIAESVIGMENVEIPMNRMLSMMSNLFRRSITLSGAFQIKQLFMDAPTAAWVSGVKNPFAVWGGTFSAFLRVLVDKDPIAQKLRSAGIGGFMSTARTPEQELALEIGLLNKSLYAKALRVLDHIGDASDYAQRVSVYKQVLKETGDEAQALLQANNVIDFLKRGSGQTAQFLSRTVSFMNAYAQSVDVLATTLAGGSLKGKKRGAAIQQMFITGALLSSVTLLYCLAVGDDEEYEKMDDSTKLRNFVIPGSKKYLGETIALPMHTSASFFFKAIPELLFNKITKDGTETEMDRRRVIKALREAFMDSMLGPNVVPTGVKPFIEIGLNKNFWTGSQVIPRGMEDIEAADQYNASTSELGKILSALTSVPGTDDKRLLAPIEADHLMRGLLGSFASMAMWGTNLLAEDRPEARAKDLPVVGAFILPSVPRGREELFYDLKEATDKKWKTYNTLNEREKFDEADKYLEKNFGLISLHDYTSQMAKELQELNKEIRRIGTLSGKSITPKERREQMDDFGNLKNEILEGIESFRRQAED